MPIKWDILPAERKYLVVGSKPLQSSPQEPNLQSLWTSKKQ